ncbi:uncharacterized protein [Anoplolepis gracilipes]|uniref:uncharacterized protein n=1 Tax=Anoplolepis gracilipes TaxID=354296 RepID=UPI003BA16EF4
MFTYRQLILAVIISSAKITFTDSLEQPIYEHQDSNNPSYSQYQHVSHYTVPSTAEQYAKQLAAQQLKQHLSEVQTVHPYYISGDKVQSDLVGYPHHYHDYMSRPIGKFHYVKQGDHEYMHPSIFIAHPHPSAVHYRRKRSTDFTNVKSAIFDVATKPSLSDIKNPTIDSLLPENESNNANANPVLKNRPSDFATQPFLFGLDPNKMNSKFQAKDIDEKKDETKHSISKRHHASLITPVFLTQFTPNSAKVTEPTQQTLTSQEKEQNQEPSSTNHENLSVIPNVHSTNLEQPSSSITTPQMKSSAKEAYNNYYGFGSPWSFLFPSSAFSFRPVYTPIYSYGYNPNRRKYMYQTVQNRLKKKSSQETTNFIAQPRNDEIKAYLCANGLCSTDIEDVIKNPFNEESLRSKMVVPNPSPPQPFHAFPDYYLNDYLKDITKDYPNNLETIKNYQEYNYDDEYTPDLNTYLTDGYQIYITKNSAYLPNLPSTKIYDDIIYGNINPGSAEPVRYIASNIPQRKELFLYYYPITEPHVIYRPEHYSKYYYDNYQNVFYPLSSPLYY